MEDKVSCSQLAKSVIILNEKDNVCVALRDIIAGKYALAYDGAELLLTIKQRINAGFKVSLTHIKRDAMIYKYGHVIGIACKDIEPGERIHIDNMRGLADIRSEVGIR